jgi:hypothetical protein
MGEAAAGNRKKIDSDVSAKGQDTKPNGGWEADQVISLDTGFALLGKSDCDLDSASGRCAPTVRELGFASVCLEFRASDFEIGSS